MKKGREGTTSKSPSCQSRSLVLGFFFFSHHPTPLVTVSLDSRLAASSVVNNKTDLIIEFFFSYSSWSWKERDAGQFFWHARTHARELLMKEKQRRKEPQKEYSLDV